MEKTIRTLRLPVELLDRAEREDRLPPGAGLLVAFGMSLLFYAVLIAVVA